MAAAVESATELNSFIMDVKDEECPCPDLHQAAFGGEAALLESLLAEDKPRQLIHAKIRPFQATPLRLAATGWEWFESPWSTNERMLRSSILCFKSKIA